MSVSPSLYHTLTNVYNSILSIVIDSAVTISALNLLALAERGLFGC